MKKRIYISGPISGIPFEEAKIRFELAELKLRTAYPNAKMVNPTKHPLPKGMRWEWYMLIDLFLLSFCTHIYQLEGWENSDGAVIEERWSQHMKIKKVLLDPEKSLKKIIS